MTDPLCECDKRAVERLNQIAREQSPLLFLQELDKLLAGKDRREQERLNALLGVGRSARRTHERQARREEIQRIRSDWRTQEALLASLIG